MSSRGKKQLSQKFKKLGLKFTRQRKVILDTLASVSRPVSIEELKKIAGAKIDIATFYRNVKTLKRAGLARRIELMRGHALWERSDLGDHHHLICVSCKRIEDIHNCNVDSLAKKAISRSKNFRKVTGHSLELFGLCKLCTR